MPPTRWGNHHSQEVDPCSSVSIRGSNPVAREGRDPRMDTDGGRPTSRLRDRFQIQVPDFDTDPDTDTDFGAARNRAGAPGVATNLGIAPPPLPPPLCVLASLREPLPSGLREIPALSPETSCPLAPLAARLSPLATPGEVQR